MNQKMKKKLLVFTSTFPRWKNDTIPYFVYELSKQLTKSFDVSILAPSYPGAKDFEVMDKMKVYRFHYLFKKYETLAGHGGILPVLKKNKLNYFKVPFFLIGEYLALKKLVKKINPNIIHAHWVIPQGLIASKIKNEFGAEYVVTSHGSDLMGLKGFTQIKKEILQNSNAITVVSNSLKKEVLNIDLSLNKKIQVIPMGVNTILFNPNKKDLSIKKKNEIDGPFLLFVGRIAPEKGIDLLIEAMPEVIKNNSKIKLMIIGDGTLKEELKKRANQLGIQTNLIWMDWIDNKYLPKYYATADIFLGPSRTEGFGLAFVEAGLCGCWLIGTKTGGIKDIIKNKKNGFFINPENSNDLVEKIILSLKLKKNKEKIRKTIINKFSLNLSTKKYIEVLK